MQELTGNVEQLKNICYALKELESSLDDYPTPFCIVRLVYSDNVACNIKLIFSNKAFQTKVNRKIPIGGLFKTYSATALEYWLGPLEAVAKTKTEIVCNNYLVAGGHVTFLDVTVFPFKKIQDDVFIMVFERPIYNTSALCLKCPNNPTVTNPTLKMAAVVVEDLGYSVCEICLTVRSLPAPKP